MAETKDFTSAIIEDLKALGFVWTSERVMQEYFDYLTRGDVQLFFRKGQLQEIRVGTRISISDMGKDNLSNKELRDAFRAIDNSDNFMNFGPGIGPEEMGNFKYWMADMQLGLKIPYLFHGESKESTPFYTQIYPDIVKLTQISDTYKNFNELSFKDQIKQIGKDVKGMVFPKKDQKDNLKSQAFSKDGKIDILKLTEYDNLIQNPINEDKKENLDELIDLSTSLFESKPENKEGKSPINPIETQSEEITKSSETIESKGPFLENKATPSNLPAQDNVINPTKEEVKTEAGGSQSGDTYITTYNTSTVNDTVVNQTNTQNNIDERKKVNNFETTNVSESGGGTTVVNSVNEVTEEKKTESPTEEVEDVGPVLNPTMMSRNDITEEDDKEITLDDFINSEYLEATNAYFGKTSNTTINNPVNSPTTNVSESKSETSEGSTELTSTLNEISENLTTNTNTLNTVVNNTTNKPGGKTSITEEDDKEITLDDFINPEYLEATNAYFGKTSNTAINSTENVTSNSTNTSNENINSENVTSNMTEVKSGTDNLELNKTPVGLDKSVAPINTVNNTSTTAENMTQSKTEETNVTESSNPSNVTSNVTTETLISNETTNQSNTEGSKNMMSSSSVGGSAPVDLSEVATRLRRLEDLLSGPLEVRVIN